MKSFKAHLQEATKKKVIDPNITICDLLKLDLDTVVDLMKRGHEREQELNWKTSEHLDAITEWFDLGVAGRSKAAFMKYIQTMAACPNKASWASWQGTAYRGVAKSKEWVKTNLKFTGETVVKEFKLYVITEAVYQSKFAAQSWTDNWKTATKFSTRYSARIPLIFQTQLNRNNTFLSPKFSNRYEFEENEVIRVENKPTKMKVYVGIEEILNKIGFMHLATSQYTNNPVKFLRDGYMKDLGGVFGEANAKKLMSSPKVLARIADMTGVAV